MMASGETPVFRRYGSELAKMGLIKKAVHIDCVYDLLLVRRTPTALYRLAVDYCLFNASIIKIMWPMRHVDAAMQDMQGAKVLFLLILNLEISNIYSMKTLKKLSRSWRHRGRNTAHPDYTRWLK